MSSSSSAGWLLVLCAAAALIGGAGAARAQVKGDVNGDGQFTPADAVRLSRALLAIPGSEILEGTGDVAPIIDGIGGDFLVNAGDAVLMMRALAEYDVDGDGLDTDGENALGTSPFTKDTDGDGHIDPDDPHPLVLDPPGVPGGLRIVDGPGGITLIWTTPAGQTGSYVIHRYGTDGEYTFFSADGAAQSFVDTTAASGTVYFYWVQPVHPTGLEGEFVDCDVTNPENNKLWLTGAIGPLPNPHFTASVAPGEVTLTWEPSTDPSVIGYRIYRSSVAVPLGSTASLQLEETVNGASTTSTVISSLSTGKHYFRITAFSAATESLLGSAKQVVVDVP